MLTDGIQAVCDNLTAHIAALPTGHPQAEETYQLLTHIIFIHTGRHATPASLARNVLESATTAFPNNTTFLSLFLWGEAGGRVYGRVHSLVTRLTSEDDKEGENASPGAVALLWSVWAEASGATAFWNGGADRVRRALDRGVNTST